MLELYLTTETLLQEIHNKKFKRDNIVMTYALALMSTDTTDWKRVNTAIINRWSLSALEYIKNKAWGMIKQKRGHYDWRKAL